MGKSPDSWYEGPLGRVKRRRGVPAVARVAKGTLPCGPSLHYQASEPEHQPRVESSVCAAAVCSAIPWFLRSDGAQNQFAAMDGVGMRTVGWKFLSVSSASCVALMVACVRVILKSWNRR